MDSKNSAPNLSAISLCAAAALTLILISSNAVAQSTLRNTRNEITSPTTGQSSLLPNQELAPAATSTRKVKAPTPKKFSMNSFTEFSGPSAEFSLPFESYSPYTDDFSPMQLFQSLSLAYAAGKNVKVGTEWSGVKPLQSDVIDKFGGTYNTDFIFFDPITYVDAFSILDSNHFWVNSRFALSAPISEFSRESGKITDLYAGFFWKLKLRDPNWYFGVNLESWIYFWKNADGYNVFSGSVGHNLGYRFSNAWSLDTGSVFDCNYVSRPNSQPKFFEGSVDRLRLTLRYQPVIDTVQLGAFFQTPIYDRRPERMALGANLNLWF